MTRHASPSFATAVRGPGAEQSGAPFGRPCNPTPGRLQARRHSTTGAVNKIPTAETTRLNMVIMHLIVYNIGSCTKIK